MRYNSYQCNACLKEGEIPCVLFSTNHPLTCPFEGDTESDWDLLVRGDK